MWIGQRMSLRGSMVVLAACLAAPRFAFGQTADAPSPNDVISLIHTLNQAVEILPDEQERSRTVRALVRGYQDRDRGTPAEVYEFGAVHLWGAGRLMQAGETTESLVLLRRVCESNAVPAHRQQAWRLTGQILESRGRLGEAAEAFEHQLELCSANPGIQGTGGCESGAMHLADIRRRQRRPQDALDLYARVAQSQALPPGDEMRLGAARQRAVLLDSIGRKQESLDETTAYLAAHPAWGVADGQRLRWYAAQCRLLRELGRASDAAAAAAPTWEAARASGHMTLVEFGQEYANDLASTGRVPEAMEVRSQVAGAIDTNEPKWSNAVGWKRVQETRLTLLGQLVEADRFDRPELALASLDRIRTLVPDPSHRADFDGAERRIRAALDRMPPGPR